LGLTFGQLDDTVIGSLSFAAGDEGLRHLEFCNLKTLKSLLNNPDEIPSQKGLETISKLLLEINAYLFGIQKEFTVAIDWSDIKGFQKEVLRITAEIPYGRLMTYGGIAEKIGKPGAARAVGAALGRNPLAIVIPCHRVIGTDYKLHGFGGGLDTKAFLLELEGHTIKNQKVILPDEKIAGFQQGLW